MKTNARPAALSPTTLALAAGLLAHGAALGQDADRPWYVGVTQDFSYDSNVLGTSTDEIDDTISTTSLRGGLNQRLGRQRLRADAELSHQRYKDLTERNNNGYRVGATLDWETIERLSGSLALRSQRRQTSFSVAGITPVSLSNIERSDDLAFRARLGVVTMLGFELGLGHRRVEFSAPEYASREYKQNNASFGIVYRPSSILSLSTGVSGADTRYLAPATGQTERDRSERRDVYVAANWVPTGASTVDARLSFGKTEYDLATTADFEGVTGALTWSWRPGGRLSTTTILSRESGQESGFLPSPDDSSATTATDFARVTNRIRVGARYELTGKTDLSAGIGYARRAFTDPATGAGGRDNNTTVALGVRWAATRILTFGCDVSRETRRASGAGSSDLDNDRFGCFGSATLD